ncbi:MAG: hypothetical protein KY461_11555 [Actinobacteria bacterium]|nr:hypothetical protein [Actinomycetota bacterium]
MSVSPGGTEDARAFAAVLGERPVRAYPALLSTEAAAQAWAREGAPAGAVVVADYQVSPRGRSGRPLDLDPERHLGFSLVLRPELTPEREGWLYTVTTVGLARALDGDVGIRWPDVLVRGDRTVADVGVHAELGPARVDWAVATVLVEVDGRDRPSLLRDAVVSIELALEEPLERILDRQRTMCRTFGDDVRAMMIPMGPGGPRIEGVASDVKDDGSLVIATDAGGRVAVRPQHLGELQPRAG